MLYYCEFKDAIERGFINQDTIMTSRINGQLHDYILEGEPIKPHEIITIEKVSDVLKELETCEFPNITFTEVKQGFNTRQQTLKTLILCDSGFFKFHYIAI